VEGEAVATAAGRGDRQRNVNRLREQFRRAALTYRTEGFLALARRASAHAAGWLFRYETYYLYEANSSTYRRRSDHGFVPKVDGLSFRVVFTDEEADEVEAQGFHFRKYVVDTKGKLDKGAIAFCVFVGHELANIGWLCTTQRARDGLKEPPATVDFSNGEAWAGGAWTAPRYRRMGLHTYSGLKRDEWWFQKGIVRSKWAVARSNAASLGADIKTGNLRYGEGRYLKILWWKSWREKPLTPQRAQETRK